MKLTRDISVTYMRVAFTLWILFFHSVNEFIPTPSQKAFPIHDIAELEFMKGVTLCVLMGFVFISGLLMARGYFTGRYSDTKAFILDKCKRLLIPYCFWCLALVLLYNVGWIEVLDGAKHIWFLLMLFEVMVVAIFAMPLLRRTSPLADALIGISLIVITALGRKFFSPPYLLGWINTLEYAPAFFVGILMVKYGLDEKLRKVSAAKFYSFATVIFILAIGVTFTRSLPLGLFYMDIPYYFTPPCIYIIIERICRQQSTGRYIASLDKNSLGIYILHQFIGKYTLLHYVPGYAAFYDGHPVMAPMLLFVEMLFVAWVTSELLHKTDIGSLLLGGYTKRKI